MKRDNLNTMFGNILQQCGRIFTRDLAISLEEWTKIRADFFQLAAAMARRRLKRKEEKLLIPEG